MDLTTDFKSFEAAVKDSVLNVSAAAAQIPTEKELSFYRSASTEFSQKLDTQSARLLRLTNKILKTATKESNLPAPRLQDHDALEDNWRGVVDVIDDLLERTDASLDEFSGVLKRLSPSRQNMAEAPAKQSERPKKVPMTYGYSNLPKPQLDFQTRVNNYLKTPFKPLLRVKPHASVPLNDAIAPGGDGKYKHPYAFEIEQSSYPDTVYAKSPPLPFLPAGTSSPVFVDTEEGVQMMLGELKLAKEIAVDLEHHDTHSYIGLVSLMQISTRKTDWIVDTLKPWRENLQVLNEVFADPNILKVFHGSTMDMIWLQRDLGLYVVGLFDTFHAAVSLDFPKKSLAYLLERFADFHAQKKYQLADWRVRPLPDELIDYACSDTHYLLFIYDTLRNMLLEASTADDNFIDRVLAGSKKEALQTYERPVYDKVNGMGPVGWFKPLMQRTVRFDKIQFAVYRALHEWRDDKARALDEGEQHIMTFATLWTLAEAMPMSPIEMHRVLRPMPAFVSSNSKDIIAVIRKAKFEGLTGPSIGEMMQINEKKFGTLTYWKTKPKPPTQDPHRGLGQTMKLLAANGELNAHISASDTPEKDSAAVRSHSSLLWGSSLPPSAQTVTGSTEAASNALRSVLPLTALSSISYSEATPPTTSLSAPISGVATFANNEVLPTVSTENDTFVIRDHTRSSRKRKVDHELAAEALAPDLPTLPVQTSQYSASATLSNGSAPPPIDAILQGRIAKQQKKAAKAARKVAEAQAQAITVPFDYANADSILHAKSDSSTAATPGSAKGSGKPMNPFAKALDTGTGAKRLKQAKEQSGKSMTFKS